MYFVAVSRQNAAAPSEQEAILTQPPSRPDKAILNPSPILPKTFSFGTTQSSKITDQVG